MSAAVEGPDVVVVTDRLPPAEQRIQSLRKSYERVLRLVDLSIECTDRRSRRRELLLWRDVVAQLYVAPEPDRAAHSQAFRCLLYFTPESARQIPFVTLR